MLEEGLNDLKISIWLRFGSCLRSYFCLNLTECLYPQVETVTLMTTRWAASCETLNCMRLVQAPARSEGWSSAEPSTPCSNKTATEQIVITRDLLGAFQWILLYSSMQKWRRNALDGLIQHNRNGLMKTDMHIHLIGEQLIVSVHTQYVLPA